MKKIISFSFWGNNSKYTIGAIRNAELAAKIYPDWECWFHVPGYYEEFALLEPYLEKIRQVNNKARIIAIESRGNWTGMFWRFLPMCQNKFDAVISRDCDSRLSQREKSAVDEWLMSDKGFHAMHCHFHHSVPILGGLFGIKKNCLPEFGQLMLGWTQEDRLQTDQEFLAQKIWPIVCNQTMNHADFHTNIWPGIPFPTPIEPGTFIGATYDENDKIDPIQLRQLYG